MPDVRQTTRDAQDGVPRRPIVVANWKMYLGAAATIRAARLCRTFTARVAGKGADVVLCPSFPLLPAVRDVLKGSRLFAGAQDLHHEVAGPYTGDVSAEQLKGLIRYVIVGHSERRRTHGETDQTVAQKVRQALRAGFRPIVCVGETAQERDDGETVSRVRAQVAQVAAGIPALSFARCVFAYEPVWAIRMGIGKASPQPDPADAAQIMGLIRKVVADRAGQRYAERVRVVYGGSVDAKTVRAFVEEPGVDGVLVGAASANPAEFSAIVKTVVQCRW